MQLTLKQYQSIKLFITVVLAISISQSIVLKNYIIPIFLLPIITLIVLYLRKQVKEIIADERDYQIAGKSALLAMQLFSWVSVIAMFVFYFFSETNSVFTAVGITLAFSVCALMLSYSFIFRFYIRKK